jgi:hypothetical protein
LVEKRIVGAVEHVIVHALGGFHQFIARHIFKLDHHSPLHAIHNRVIPWGLYIYAQFGAIAGGTLPFKPRRLSVIPDREGMLVVGVATNTVGQLV